MKLNISFVKQVLVFLLLKCLFTISYRAFNGVSISRFGEYYNLVEFFGDLFLGIFIVYFLGKSGNAAKENVK